jgi:hypothetical protein
VVEDDSAPEEDFPASPQTPGQIESRTARAKLEEWLKKQEQPPDWRTLWDDLRQERAPALGADGQPRFNERGEMLTRRRWDWRKALFIAWACVPKAQREPKTIEELASLLGLSSTGTIRNWRRNDPGLTERITALPKELLLNHVADVYDALVKVAKLPDPKAFNDRRLFLELAEQYTPKGTVAVSGPGGGSVPVDVVHGLGDLSDEELDALDRIAQRLAGAGGGAGATPPD